MYQVEKKEKEEYSSNSFSLTLTQTCGNAITHPIHLQKNRSFEFYNSQSLTLLTWMSIVDSILTHESQYAHTYGSIHLGSWIVYVIPAKSTQLTCFSCLLLPWFSRTQEIQRSCRNELGEIGPKKGSTVEREKKRKREISDARVVRSFAWRNHCAPHARKRGPSTKERKEKAKEEVEGEGEKKNKIKATSRILQVNTVLTSIDSFATFHFSKDGFTSFLQQWNHISRKVYHRKREKE